MVSGRAGQFGKDAASPFTAAVFYLLSPISSLLSQQRSRLIPFVTRYTSSRVVIFTICSL